MPGHPSAKKRQKESARKERQVEKAQRRDQRRDEPKDASSEPELMPTGPFVLGEDGLPVIGPNGLPIPLSSVQPLESA